MDTDIALGARRGDVDDGFALAALLSAARQGKVELLGISVVSGNVSAREALGCARRIAEVAGLPLAVTDQAADLAALPEGTQILALAPLTNVARACRLDPSLPARTSLRVVGGNLSSRGPVPPVWPFEFNLWLDRPAAREVFAAPWCRLTLFPLDVVRRLRCDAERLEQIARLSSLGRLLSDGSLRWLARARWRHLSGSFPVWDLAVALEALGELGGSVQSRRPCASTRRLLRQDAEIPCLAAFDAEAAWHSFETLLGDQKRV